ncbi:MAG TPA: uracil-DNA glycosylase [Candidatus Binataceae bacterium]|nr:uracil-DNA glycosylase [Candidatus Binataceae bacterium]
MTLETLQASMRECCACAALVKCRSRVVPGDGAVPARVMFVGIAPGRFGGDLTGIPFSGDRSGMLLREMIARTGIEEVFITNLVRCNPRDERGRNRDPLAAEIDNCRRHLEAEIAMVRPRVIVCLGAMAWRQLAGRDAPFSPSRPKIREHDGAALYPMYHPGYIIRGAYNAHRYARDFRRLQRHLAKTAPR